MRYLFCRQENPSPERQPSITNIALNTNKEWNEDEGRVTPIRVRWLSRRCERLRMFTKQASRRSSPCASASNRIQNERESSLYHTEIRRSRKRSISPIIIQRRGWKPMGPECSPYISTPPFILDSRKQEILDEALKNALGKNRCYQLVNELLKQGANPNYRIEENPDGSINRSGKTPLMLVAKMGAVRILERLLFARADP